MLDVKKDFPALFNKDIAYLDTASSAQKPQAVITAMEKAMTDHYANIHRGLYDYSQKTTQDFENVREKVMGFINAPSKDEVVFTRNTTEAINLIAQSWGGTFLQKDDEIILTEMEHHANIVPWQLLRDKIGFKINIIPVTDNGELDMDGLKSLLSDRTRLVTYTHTSNALGTVNSVSNINKIIKDFNPEIKVLIDGSQAVVHGKIDVQSMNCDFFVFTGHKLYGPSGVGVLWGKYDVLNSMPPYQGGGDMIETVTFNQTTYKSPPARFEAGTPSIVDVIGLGAAIDYIIDIGVDPIMDHEKALLDVLEGHLRSRPNIQVFANTAHKAPVISFNLKGAHHSDVAMILNQCGVAVRTGHHCCMPLMQRFGVDGTIRVSLGIYNDVADIDRFLLGLDKAEKLLA